MLWPHGEDQPYDVWMQPHQEAAIESFVTSGGSFLALAQCGVGLSMEGWLPAQRLAGYYQGHPPVASFERVVKPRAPITSV